MKRRVRQAPIKNKRPVKSLVKALRILDTLGNHPSGLGITELSGALKSPKSTVHRLVTTLESTGYVVFDATTMRYVLGSRVARLGEQVNQQSPLLTFGVPALERLTAECHEASHLAILEGAEVVYISQEESREPVRISFGKGHRAPAHCTALGKALLAGQSDSEIMMLYKNKQKLESLTARTCTKMQDLLRELEEVRKQGIAYDNEEYMPGLRCMAVPIRDFSSGTVAAVCLSMFTHKMTGARMAFFKAALFRTSAALSGKLGFGPALRGVFGEQVEKEFASASLATRR
jgi:IclR family transcriptional regulator, KDG regulon repressor